MRPPARRLGPWIAAAALIVIGSVAMAVSGLPGGAAGGPAHVQQRPSIGGFIFGIDYADELPEQSAAAVGQGLDDAGAVGAGWIRADLAWYRVQPSPGVWNWSSFDKVADTAKARGLKILAILDQPPAWAREARCAAQQWCPPADDTEFATFAAQAAQRYPADVVGAWEVWNEENIPPFWVGGPDPAGYSTLLKATAIAITAARPTAEIVLGGLALGTDRGSMTAHDFLLATAQAGGLAYVGAIAYHPYTYPTLPDAAAAFADIGTGPDSLAAVLDQYQASSMPIWLTETGASIAGAGADPDAANPVTQNEERSQAAYVTDLVHTATHNPHVKALFWFSDIDLPKQSLYFGLRRADGTHRPSYAALKQAIGAYQG